jgi:hypothetical protein
VERGAWTDERLDDLSRRVDAGFQRLDARIDDLGSTLGGRIDALGTRIDALQMTLVRVGGGVIIGLVGVIVAILARG